MACENCGPGPLVSVCAEDPAPQGQEELGQAGPADKAKASEKMRMEKRKQSQWERVGVARTLAGKPQGAVVQSGLPDLEQPALQSQFSFLFAPLEH